ncbi:MULTISPECIES: HlyD family secretion protein [Methylobacterium]|uniref:Colistin resistance protein EmrA n=3 Tax=Pseudomonadota TaxID=1224 RepID=A0ABQ4SSP8_9HYPH|nr:MULTISPECIES: HlyD family secretion protein [Methylobacterium]PIU04593.1 MAG: secretion protein HylD [Methylobacterium sp. CG09_land_8_20_14_0_10_71_15]PIU15970.1 MAG: secretion protein HylD [Methylobacterium sp. CG08_land_8_20_14_0_20_71_15]GBU17731.1 multidrug resistance efflux pump [Methylobacterium sp.]GJE04880.1 Colistin resistance protein EmrA [Methylobacterium jeotgali]
MLDNTTKPPRADASGAGTAPDDRTAAEARETGRKPGEAAPEENERTQPSGTEGGESDADESRPNVLRRHPVWFALGALALVALAVAGYFYWLTALHPYETTDDAFVDARSFSVAPKVSGYVVEVPVTDNQHVEAGQILFRIDRRDYEVALRQADAQVQSAQASIQNVDAQIEGQRAQVDVAKAQVTQTKASLDFAQQDAARYQELAKRGAGTVQQSQQSTSNLEQQQASLQRAQASVIAAQKQIGSLEAQKASAEASLATAQAQKAQAELNLGYTDVTAAQPGRVVRLSGAKGQYAQAGQSLSMFVPDDVWVTANYKETQITDMRPGQAVDVEIDAYPGRKISGRVASVQPGSGTAFSLLPAQNATGNFVKVVQRVPVKIVVERWPDDVAIGPGLSVVPSVRVR